MYEERKAQKHLLLDYIGQRPQLAKKVPKTKCVGKG